MTAPRRADAPGPGDEARLVAALGAALERGAARAEPVAVVVALLRGDERDRAAALVAARTEVPPDGLAARIERRPHRAAPARRRRGRGARAGGADRRPLPPRQRRRRRN